jgi:hypothetical protein
MNKYRCKVAKRRKKAGIHHGASFEKTTHILWMLSR